MRLRATAATGVPIAASVRTADRKVKCLDIGGQVFLEREGHGLRHARTAAHRQLGLGEGDLGARHQEQHAPPGRERQRVGDGAGACRAGSRAIGIDDEPRRRRLRGGSEPYHQCLCHRTSGVLLAAETAQDRPNGAL